MNDIALNFAIYKSHLDNLEGSETANGSLLNLKYKSKSEYDRFLQCR